jgi:saccharopine dehydrogenase (NAD+, L-lysine forming)
LRILIFGHGAVGSVLAKLLNQNSKISQIICADIRFKEEEKIGKLNTLNIDLKNKTQLIKLIQDKKPSLVVNASSPWFNKQILNACLETKSNYMDMAACWEPETDKNAKSPYKIEQFEFDKDFRSNKLFGLIESGVSPGITNLFVRECADEFDELDTVKIRLIDFSGTDELTFSWSKEALLDEINSKPLIYKNNKFEIVEPFSGEENYEFPNPYKKKKTYYICQDEIGTIPFFIKLKNIDIKDFDNQIEIHKFLYKLGLTSKEKIKFEEKDISPFDFVNKILPDVTIDFSDKKFDSAQFAFAVEANGKINGKNKTIRYYIEFPKQKEIGKMGLGSNFITYPTALSAKIFISASHLIKTEGIIPPEALDKEVRKFIISELKKNNVKITKEFW